VNFNQLKAVFESSFMCVMLHILLHIIIEKETQLSIFLTTSFLLGLTVQNYNGKQ